MWAAGFSWWCIQLFNNSCVRNRLHGTCCVGFCRMKRFLLHRDASADDALCYVKQSSPGRGRYEHETQLKVSPVWLREMLQKIHCSELRLMTHGYYCWHELWSSRKKEGRTPKRLLMKVLNHLGNGHVSLPQTFIDPNDDKDMWLMKLPVEKRRKQQYRKRYKWVCGFLKQLKMSSKAVTCIWEHRWKHAKALITKRIN